jgi:hypothetical protein
VNVPHEMECGRPPNAFTFSAAYDIQTSNWVTEGRTIQPSSVALAHLGVKV